MPDARTFSALAHELRLRIFRLLIRCGPAGMPAGQIALRLEVPASTLSAHLQRLVEAGLLEARRQQQRILYAVNQAGTRELIDYLVSDCCAGRPELCGFGPDHATVNAPKSKRNKRAAGAGCC